MSQRAFEPSELILNPDGTIYHLSLGPEHIADTVLIVGDQDRVDKVSRYFDTIEFKIQKREFRTHTGTFRGRRLTVASTGIGTDNVEIFLNELDAAVNIDMVKKHRKHIRRQLNIIRLGTCGALHGDIEVGSQIISSHGLGLGGLLHYYQYPFSENEREITEAIVKHLDFDQTVAQPYIVKGSESLFNVLGSSMTPGITATAPGFYAPQGRQLCLPPRYPDITDKLKSFRFDHHRVTNFEMETSVLYGLGNMLGHQCITCCVVLANRVTGEYSEDYAAAVDRLITNVLEQIALH